MNSRLSVSNYSLFNTLVERCVSQAVEQHIRAVVIVRSAPENWLSQLAAHLDCDFLPASSTTDRSDRIAALLGSERQAAVIQLAHKPDLGLLAAVAGTIRAGGLSVINIPDLPPQVTARASNSLKRLCAAAQAMAKAHPEHVLLVDYPDISDAVTVNCGDATVTSPGTSLITPLCTYYNPLAATEQDTLLNTAYRHVAADCRSCLIITGRRGRGKSTLLARLASRLAKEGAKITVTAMHESALRTYRRHAGSIGQYQSPESIIAQPVDTLLIDEAASFPIGLLQTYARTCRHLLLGTTVEGYEATGRALPLRLMSDDLENVATMRQLTPTHPWRWSIDDPLEALIDQLLLTRVTVSSLTPTDDSAEARRALARLSKPRRVCHKELIDDELLLTEIQALLLSTHYQSGSKDLEHMLDAPTVELWIQQIDNSVVGVLLLEYEGAIEKSLHEDVVSKHRRLRHQLLPQLLAQMVNSTAGLTKRYVRVLRLATVPELRRQGIASRLLSAVIEQVVGSSDISQNQVATDAISAIGASFAADNGSLKFWRSQGFEEFHRGFQSNPRTGKRAVTVMRSYDTLCSALLHRAVMLQTDNELSRSLAQQAEPYPASAFDGINADFAADRELLLRFAAGQRSQHDTFAALYRLSSSVDLPLQKSAHQSHKHYEKVLRNQVTRWIDSSSCRNIA